MKPTLGLILEYVDNIEEARTFYRDTLGLKEERYHPTFVQFEGFAIASDSPVSGSRERELYWVVDDVDAAYHELKEHTSISMEMKDLRFGRVFGVRSPGGEPHFILQWAANRPSAATSA